MKTKLFALISIPLILFAACSSDKDNTSSGKSEEVKTIQSTTTEQTKQAVDTTPDDDSKKDNSSSKLKPEYLPLVDEINTAFERGYHYSNGAAGGVWRKGDYSISSDSDLDRELINIVVGKQDEKLYIAQKSGDAYVFVSEYDRLDDMGDTLLGLIRQLEAYSTSSTFEQWGQEKRVANVKLEKNQETTVATVDLVSDTENITSVYYITDGLIDKYDWNGSGDFLTYEYVSRGPIEDDFIIEYYNEIASEFSKSNT